MSSQSRLPQLQAKYQENRKNEIKMNQSEFLRGGKVRQMFDERRQRLNQTTPTGIDKSYPLEPLKRRPVVKSPAAVKSPAPRIPLNSTAMKIQPVKRPTLLQGNEKSMKTETNNNVKTSTIQIKLVTKKPEVITSPITNVVDGMDKLQIGKSNDDDDENMKRCTICGRQFLLDRIVKHEEICRKTKEKKRKVFDVKKHRLEGTEAEPFHKKSRFGGPKKIVKATTTAPKKSDWRRKHEEFIAAIRAAKEVKQHLERGGKLSDLPPPPPAENPDYVQCPNCKRKFNEQAASRHIPKCTTFQHNKPKPVARKRF